jgi:hypothetical protein
MERRTALAACAVASVPLLVAGCATARPPAALAELAKSARTPEAHRTVALGYREHADRLRGDAARHVSLAEWWSSASLDAGETRHAARTRSFREQQARHCRSFAELLSRAATEAEAIADAHDRWAVALADR